MPHILIVEDQPVTAWALAEGFTDDGHTIDTFASAEEAGAWLAQSTADLVIADVRLPGMTGLAFARALRRSGARVPVILVSAYGEPASATVLRRAGVVACFTKPFRMDLLRAAVRRALAPRALRRRAARAAASARRPAALRRAA